MRKKINMKNRKGSTIPIILLLIVSSLVIFQSAFVEQWGPIDEFIEAYVEHPKGIFIVIVTWFVLLYILKQMDIRVTPWYAAICFLIAIIVGYAFIYQNVEPELAPPEEARNSVISYVQDHHPTTVRLFDEMVWSGEDTTPSGLEGEANYQYLGGGWNVTFSWAIVAKPTYKVKAIFTSPKEGLSILWEGTVDDTGAVEERIKGSTQNTESVRDSALDYITEHHPDDINYFADVVWDLKIIEPILGWIKYTYIGDGWNATISYEVYYDTTYQVTVDNAQEKIMWKGTVYDGVVNETSYEK